MYKRPIEYDSIILNYNCNLKDIEINQNYFEKGNACIQLNSDGKYKATQKRFNLNQKVKSKIYGLEKLEINKSDYYGDSINIAFNAKINKARYLDNIHKNNIDTSFNNLFNNELKDIINIDYENIIKNGMVGIADVNNNIDIPNTETILYLDSILYNTDLKRNIKSNTNFKDNKTLYLKYTKNIELTIYEKFNHLISDKEHSQYVIDYPNILKEAVDKLRMELRFTSMMSIREHILKDFLKAPTLENVLNADNNNIIYNILNDNRIANIKDITTIKDIPIDDKDLLLGFAIYTQYKDYETVKKEIKKTYDDYSKRSKEKKKCIQYMKYYIDYMNIKENNINYSILFNEVLEKLKVA